MTLAAYQPREDAPVSIVYRGDLRPGLACEDRDLIAESENFEAAVDCALEVNCALYPPLLFGTFTIPTIQN